MQASPQPHGDASRVSYGGREHHAVRLVDLAGLQRLAGFDQLGTRGQDQHPRA